MKRQRFFIITLSILVLLVFGLYLLRTPISLAIAERVIAQRLNANPLAELPDGLHVGLCGAGSPFPDDKRSGPCTLVIAGQRQFIFDTGSGTVRNLGKMGFSPGQVDAVFLTHFHSDHIDGMGEFLLQRWVSASNENPVPVYGPKGVETVVQGIMQAYKPDQGYRVAHHGEATMPPSGFGGMVKSFAPPAQGTVTLIKDADLEIIAFTVEHGPIHPAVGYRINYKGRSLLISGDTIKSATVQAQARNVDLLLHEALSVPLTNLLEKAADKAGKVHLKKIFNDITNYHTTPEQAAEIARDAKVGSLLLNHIAPPLPLPGMESAFLGDAGNIYQGKIRVGVDGDFVSMPVGSKQIVFSKRF
ncbi:MAG: MBL fold metallo-hydrolase [Undibacterium umbellatum]|uniref:MBL fold metallo-hydrolase n=1 Tax=Undibacterium umbellatum TaxID=2762300 RepID=UPI003BB7966E